MKSSYIVLSLILIAQGCFIDATGKRRNRSRARATTKQQPAQTAPKLTNAAQASIDAKIAAEKRLALKPSLQSVAAQLNVLHFSAAEFAQRFPPTKPNASLAPFASAEQESRFIPHQPVTHIFSQFQSAAPHQQKTPSPQHASTPSPRFR